MSNINPNPRFEPTPGKPTAARPFFPYVEHLNMAQVMVREASLRNARASRIADQFGKEAG